MRTETFDDIFSLLPRPTAALAAQRIQERLKRPIRLEAFEFRWAEFELSGGFIRGGISDISDLTTVVVDRPGADRRIDLLARRAAAGDVSAGHLEWVREHGCLLWYLPYRFYEGGKAGVRLRGIVVDSLLFSEIVGLFNGAANLTASETRVLFQLVGGVELRLASQVDRVSYETKRSHAKSAAEKLRCAGQKDLIRKLLGQLFHLMSISEADLREVGTEAAFAETYLGGDMRFAVRRHGSGAVLRYLVGGPEAGIPVFMVPGMMFPVPLRGVGQVLERHGIRLYVPIRRGYLEARPFAALFGGGNVIEQSLREAALIVAAENIAPVHLVGNSLGAHVAVRLALERPDLFTGLTLLSANLARPSEEASRKGGSFYRGMHRLKSDALLFKLVNLEYRKFYSDSETCRHILRTHFARNEADLAVLDGAYTGSAAYDMFAATYATSVVGIAEDFRHAMTGGGADASKLAIPLSIVHGDDDPLTGFEEVVAAFGGPVCGEVLPVPGAGHFASVSHADEVWAAVARAAAGAGSGIDRFAGKQ